MTGRGIGWGAGVAVVLAAITGALINELHGGWPWWVAAGVVTLVSAGLAAWLASASASAGASGVQVDEGGVHAGRDIRGRVRTRGPQRAAPPTPPASTSTSWTRGGGVSAGRDIIGDVDTNVESGIPPAGATGGGPGAVP